MCCCCCCCDEDGGGAVDAGEGSIGLGDWRDLGDKDDEGIASAISAFLIDKGFCRFFSHEFGKFSQKNILFAFFFFFVCLIPVGRKKRINLIRTRQLI